MANPTQVIIFCDTCDLEHTQCIVKESTSSDYVTTIVPLSNGPSLAKTIRLTLCEQKAHGRPFCVVNWCAGDDESTDRALTAKVTDLVENVYKCPMVGNPLMVARYDSEDLRMLMFYSDLPCNSFCVVKGTKDLAQLSAVPLPSEVSADNKVLIARAESREEVELGVAKALASHPVVLVSEASSSAESGEHTFTLIVQGGSAYNSPTLKGDGGIVSSVKPEDFKAFYSTVVSTIMGKQGHAKVTVRVGDNGGLTLTRISFNVPTPILDELSFDVYLTREVPAVLSAAKASAPRHIVSFDTVGKGYFMRAARPIVKGELVFEDERRAFALVTREHVAKAWSDADKYTFSRYAWPIDADCHVYAIWEDEPKRWRPINHSCDPNLFFAEGNSLNVIARRDIAEGEDLTLDYSTFCDYTMKPFDCFCRTPLCRGRVVPGQVPWEQYGTHAWFRREPPQVTDLVPEGMQ